jgi:hypothetical protein
MTQPPPSPTSPLTPLLLSSSALALAVAGFVVWLTHLDGSSWPQAILSGLASFGAVFMALHMLTRPS